MSMVSRDNKKKREKESRMPEKILSIAEIADTRNGEWDSNYGEYIGYVITTEAQRIEIMIDNYQQCCESWGYAMSEDDTSYYIGASLLDVKIVAKDCAKKSLKEYADDGAFDNENDAMFIDVETDIGVLQFVLYTYHNGYYSHSVKVVATQLGNWDS